MYTRCAAQSTKRISAALKFIALILTELFLLLTATQGPAIAFMSSYTPNSKGCVYLEKLCVLLKSTFIITIHDQDNNSARNMEDVQFKRNGSLVGYIRISTGSVTYSDFKF